MDHPHLMKKPKLEEPGYVNGGDARPAEGGGEGEEEDDGFSLQEQEEALVALVEHRTKEVEHLKQKMAYYTSQLDGAGKRLKESQSKLARLRSKSSGMRSNNTAVRDGGATVHVKVERTSASPVRGGRVDEVHSRTQAQSQSSSRPQPVHVKVERTSASPVRGGRVDEVHSRMQAQSQSSSQPQPVHVKVERTSASPVRGGRVDEVHPRMQAQSQSSSRPQLLIPAVNHKIPTQPVDPKIGRPVKTEVISTKPSVGGGMGSRANSSSSTTPFNNADKSKRDSASNTPIRKKESVDSQEKRARRKLGQKEHQDLIQSIRSSSSPCLIRFQPGTVISSQHKRKLRCLALSPVNNLLFATSALDGVVNLWQVQAKGPNASLLSTTDSVSPKQRRWPEDITWHPDGDSLFAAYSADGGDSQISIMNLNSSRENRVTFLEEKPHIKGIINSIYFMPWVDLCFATGGSDHGVILWSENDGSWKPKAVHRNQHSSAVMGVAGLQQKKIIMSAGADKRIVGYDLLAGRADFKHQIESKCMSVLPNPTDFNLFMVQTGAPGRQLRLFDIRLRQTEIHAFGWKQESSESQSALINQAWSPDGLYISSGSADPMIHIFDIRYDAREPAQSVQAHQKRVFKAVWHQSLPLLISISSDLNIGLHRII